MNHRFLNFHLRPGLRRRRTVSCHPKQCAFRRAPLCRIFPMLTALLFAQSLVLAQVRINTGDITCSVSDPQGKTVPGASVGVSDESRGFKQNAVTNEEGQSRFPLLPPSRYAVHVQAQGFVSVVIEDVEVLVGQTVRIDAKLKLATSETTVIVTAEPPVVDPEKSEQASAIDSERIEYLPINRRNYLDFALLTPGVVETTTIGDAFDFRVAVAPTSGLGFAGSNGRGNTFAIDGIENNGSNGNVRPSVAQAAVQEFQVNRNSYSAEYGGGYGGAINIVSKSGTNQVHGSLFGYLRHRDLQARNYFDPSKSAFTREQSGASVGAPLRKDQTYFFAALERLDRHETAFVPILSDPDFLRQLTPSQQQLISFFDRSGNPQLQSLSGLLRQILTPTNNPIVEPMFRANSGAFPFSSQDTQFSVRFDHRLSDRHRLFFRANLTNDTDENSHFGALVGLTRGSTTKLRDRTVAGQYVFELSPHWLGVSRVSFAYSSFEILSNDPYGPALDISGYGSFGRDPYFPYDLRERHLQFQQSFTYSGANHFLKFGTDLNPIYNTVIPSTVSGGRFVFGAFLPLGLILNTVTGNPNFSSGLATTLASLGQAQLASNLNDPLNSLQAFSLGLPVVYVQGFGNGRASYWQRRFSTFIEDSYRLSPRLTLTLGLRHQFDGNENIKSNTNISPRFGFAWTPTADGKTIIRGGYGLFHSFTDLIIPFSAVNLSRPDQNLVLIPLTGVPVTNPMTGQSVNSADIYLTLLAQGVIGHRTIRSSDLGQFGIPPGFRFPLTGGVERDYTNPYAEQASLEIERSLGDFSVSAAYNFQRTLFLDRKSTRLNSSHIQKSRMPSSA